MQLKISENLAQKMHYICLLPTPQPLLLLPFSIYSKILDPLLIVAVAIRNMHKNLLTVQGIDACKNIEMLTASL